MPWRYPPKGRVYPLVLGREVPLSQGKEAWTFWTDWSPDLCHQLGTWKECTLSERQRAASRLGRMRRDEEGVRRQEQTKKEKAA